MRLLVLRAILALLAPAWWVIVRLERLEQAAEFELRCRGKSRPGDWVRIVRVACPKCRNRLDASGKVVHELEGKAWRISRYDPDTDEYVLDRVLDAAGERFACEFVHAEGLELEKVGPVA